MKRIITYSIAAFMFSGMVSVLSAQNKQVKQVTETIFDAVEASPAPGKPVLPSKGTIVPMAQLYDNGPIVNVPGGGTNGEDLSALHDGMTVLGFGHSIASGTRVADDFTVPSGEHWTIDSVVFYHYQTNSGNASTINSIHLAVRNVDPLTSADPSGIFWGDTTTEVFDNTYWSGVYRTGASSYTSTARPIMKSSALTINLSLPAGKYWLDWQIGGTGASGPWAPPITFASQMITGDGLQFNAGQWIAVDDTATAGTQDDSPQGFPFIIYGSNTASVDDIYNNTNVVVFPNPMTTESSVQISADVIKASEGFSFVAYDMLGNRVKELNGINAHNFKVGKDGLANGAFIYEVLNGTEVIKRGKLFVK